MTKEYIADKKTLDAVNNKVGNAGDAVSGSSVFAKLNSLLATLGSHVAAWTSTRATKIDNLDKLNTGVPVSNLNGKIIKSIQRGIITIATNSTSQAATIKSVNTAKAFVVFGGATGMVTTGGYPSVYSSNLALTNATTVTATKENGNVNNESKVPYQVVEFE